MIRDEKQFLETYNSLLFAIQCAGGSVTAVNPDMTLIELIDTISTNNIRFIFRKPSESEKDYK